MKLDEDKLYLYVQGLDPKHLAAYLGGMIYLGILTANGEDVGEHLFESPEAPTLSDLYNVADHASAESTLWLMAIERLDNESE